MMIAKEVAKKTINQTSFKKLADYITRKKGEKQISPKITNCANQNYETALKSIDALQNLSKVKSDKTYHLVLSFHKDDDLSEEKLAFIENECCKILGFEEHQRISAFHLDTNNPHLHIAINRINPRTNRAITPYFSYRKLSNFCQKMEEKFGLLNDNHIERKQKYQSFISKQRSFSEINSLKDFISFSNLGDFNARGNSRTSGRERRGISYTTAINSNQGKSTQYMYAVQSIGSNGGGENRQSQSSNHDLLQDNQRNDLGRERQDTDEVLRLVGGEKSSQQEKEIKEWIDKRNALLGKVSEIEEHRYFGNQEGQFKYMGTRQIGDNQIVALLSKNNITYVKPINHTEAKMLKKNPRGKIITVDKKGKFIGIEVKRGIR